MEIKEVTSDDIHAILNNGIPEGLFLSGSDESGEWMAADTYSADRAAGVFTDKNAAIKWLKDSAIDQRFREDPPHQLILRAEKLDQFKFPPYPEKYAGLNWGAMDAQAELPYDLTDLTIAFDVISGYKRNDFEASEYLATASSAMSYSDFNGTSVSSLIPIFALNCLPHTDITHANGANMIFAYPNFFRNKIVLGMTLRSYLQPSDDVDRGLTVDLVDSYNCKAVPHTLEDWAHILKAAIVEDRTVRQKKFRYALFLEDENAGGVHQIEYDSLDDMAKADIGRYVPYFYQAAILEDDEVETEEDGNRDVSIAAIRCAEYPDYKIRLTEIVAAAASAAI